MIFAALAVGAFVIALSPVSDGDIYWHLAAGREILRRRALLRVDPFTVSAAGRAWVDVHWLFQTGAALVYRAAGLVGLGVAKAALVALGAVIALGAAEESGGAQARAWCAIALLGALFLARHLLPIRPVIVTLVCLSTFLWALESTRVAPRPAGWRRLLWLPACQLVWSNCQGLSLLGPALIAAYLAAALLARVPGRGRGPGAARPLAAVLVLCTLASFATPYGLAAVALPGELLSRIVPGRGNVFSAAIAENVPPLVLVRTAPDQIGHFRWFLAAAAAAFVIVRPRLHLAHGLVLLGFLGLALLANRNVLLFYWVAAPLGAVALAPTAARRLEAVVSARWANAPARAAVRGVALWTVLAAELVLGGLAQAREPAVGSPTPFHFPVESARMLVELGVSGPIFALDQHGGYLTFTVPGVRPYIDTRLVLHTGQEYAAYLSVFEDPDRFDALADAERFEAVVLPTAHPDLCLGLISHLAANPAWHLVLTDGYEVLFMRRGADLALADGAAIDGISSRLAARFASSPELLAAARLDLARLLIVLRHPRQAERTLSSVGSRAAAELRARARFSAGELGAAESLALILARDDPRDVRSLVLLAAIAWGQGRAERAGDWLRRALAIDPYDAEARSVVGRIEAATMH